MYLALPYTLEGAVVTERTVVHENEVYVWVKRIGTSKPYRQYKDPSSIGSDQMYKYFETEPEAWQWIKEVIANEIEQLNAALIEHQDEFNRIEEIIKTQSTMRKYTIYGTMDTRRFIEKSWTPVATVIAKNKEQAMAEFKDSEYRENLRVSNEVPWEHTHSYVCYKVKKV